jgi:2-polyprenyl-3-methyl-5-hydroxy-6-metoxy-1,4-benzoquinol methylase
MEASYHKSCFLCGSTKIKTLKGYEEHELAKCSACSFVFMQKIPTDQELINYYSVYAYKDEKAIPEPTRVSIEGLVGRFSPYRKNNRILDVGCGEGWILEIAKENGWEVYGTEYSSRAIEICKAKGIKMYTGVLNPDQMDVKEFDVIISSETVEHINNPKEDFNNISGLLRKGGLVYVTTPNFNSYLRRMLKSKYDIIKYPEHLSYYTRPTLNALLTSCGLKKVKLLTTGMSLTHYQVSVDTTKQSLDKSTSADEKLRRKIVKSPMLKFIKKIVNGILTFFGLGMTLKAYYVKE